MKNGKQLAVAVGLAALAGLALKKPKTATGATTTTGPRFRQATGPTLQNVRVFSNVFTPSNVPPVPIARLDAFVQRTAEDYRKERTGPLGGRLGPSLRFVSSVGQASLYSDTLKPEAGSVLRNGTRSILTQWLGDTSKSTGIQQTTLLDKFNRYSSELFPTDWRTFAGIVGNDPLAYFALRYSAEVEAAQRLHSELTQ